MRVEWSWAVGSWADRSNSDQAVKVCDVYWAGKEVLVVGSIDHTASGHKVVKG